MKVIRQLLSCPKLIACARTHTHTHTYTRTRARACKHVYTHTTCTHTNTHTYTNTHARTHMQACIYTHHLHTHTHNTQVGTWQQASQAFPPLWPPSCARDSTPHKLQRQQSAEQVIIITIYYYRLADQFIKKTPNGLFIESHRSHTSSQFFSW
jgi:hypothetical protein